MAGNLTLKQATAVTLVSSGGTVTSAAAAAANGAANITNSTTLAPIWSFRLVSAAASAPVQGTTVSLYLVPLLDGSNAAGVDTSTPYFNPNYFAGNFVWPAASAATSQRMDIDGVPLSAYDYSAYIVNNLGQSMSSGWTLIGYPTESQYT